MTQHDRTQMPLILTFEHIWLAIGHRTQMTLFVAFEHIWLAIGPHSRYCHQKHNSCTSFYVIAALESEITLKRRLIAK
ncbi:hypothetical protein CA596_05655 [Paenibacillus odorifer]|nr:hypothetical protein CA596_05655 [Paenibacillus odorifer]